MHRYFLFTILASILNLGILSSVVWAQFSPSENYEDAVPAVLNELGTAVQDIENAEEINAWADTTEASLPELLDELTTSLMTYSDQSFDDNTLSDLTLLSDKWNTIVQAYPDLEGVAVLVTPIIDQVIDSLPTVRNPRPNDSPFQNFFEFYRTLEIQNPWGVSAFFQIEPLAPTQTVLSYLENVRRQTVEGVQSTFVFKRETVVTVNNEVVFHELILDNELVQHFKKMVNVTMVHDILAQIQQDGIDPALVAAIQALVDLIDFHLAEAQNGGLTVPNGNIYTLAEVPATTQFVESLFASEQVQGVTQQLKNVLPLVSGGTSSVPVMKQAYQETVEVVPIADSVLAAESNQPTASKRVEYKSVVLDQYDKSGNNITSIWLTAIFFPLFLGIIFQFVKFALTPTVSLMKRRPDVYIR